MHLTRLFKLHKIALALALITPAFSHAQNTQTDTETAETTKTLKTVKVQAEATQDGGADAGYKTEKVTGVGMWEGRKLQDTPYSINVVSQELIENLQATSADQVFKLNPVTQFYWPQTQNDNPYVFLRGFQTTTFARNGISRQKWNYAHGTTMEEISRIEVLTGLSGFLYGAGNVGGMINFITKKPTDERLNSITLGNNGGSNYYAHGDFGGQIDSEGSFGYRINLVTQDGETSIDKQHNKRNFISAAFDWQITDSLLLEIDASKRDYRLDGRQAYWYLASGVTRPNAKDIDSSKTWGHPWTMQDMDSERLGANIRWNVSEQITLRAGYLDEYNSRTGTFASNTIQADGTFNQSVGTNENAPQKIMGTGSYGFADFSFDTGSISHKLTAGFQYSTSIWDNYPDGNTSQTFTGLTLDNPTYFEQPQWAAHGTGAIYSAYDQRTRSLNMGDDIQFNEKWSALIGVSNSKVFYKNYNTSNVLTESYEKSKLTPTLSLIYKPVEHITTYASYMEGLEQGGVAGEFFQETYAVLNASEIMEPLVSEQIELGVKASLGEMLLTAALFNIDKPLEYYVLLNESQAQFVQDGRQVHQGIEFTATGKLSENVTLMGGFTWLDAQVKENEQNPQLEGKRPIAVSEKMIKLYGEYNLPAVPGLTINGGASYTGNFYGNGTNTDKMPGYTLVDLGVRYLINAGGSPVTLRLNINNLTDERYWANQYFLGDARTVAFSANVKF